MGERLLFLSHTLTHNREEEKVLRLLLDASYVHTLRETHLNNSEMCDYILNVAHMSACESIQRKLMP